MKNNTAILFMIIPILLVSFPVYSSDITLDCDNVTYIMLCETGTYSVPDNKWDTAYAVAVFLTKKKFDFKKIASQSQNENIHIYAQGVHICEMPIEKFTSGTLHFMRDKEKEAFLAARTICKEKTDPDLRR